MQNVKAALSTTQKVSMIVFEVDNCCLIDVNREATDIFNRNEIKTQDDYIFTRGHYDKLVLF